MGKHFKVTFDMDGEDYFNIENDTISGFVVQKFGIHDTKPEKGIVHKKPDHYFGRLCQCLYHIMNEGISDSAVSGVRELKEVLRSFGEKFEKFDKEFRKKMLEIDND